MFFLVVYLLNDFEEIYFFMKKKKRIFLKSICIYIQRYEILCGFCVLLFCLRENWGKNGLLEIDVPTYNKYIIGNEVLSYSLEENGEMCIVLSSRNHYTNEIP